MRVPWPSTRSVHLPLPSRLALIQQGQGTLTPLLGVGLCVSIQFGVFERMKREFGAANAARDPALKGKGLSGGQLYLAGAAAGLTNSFVAGECSAPLSQAPEAARR